MTLSRLAISSACVALFLPLALFAQEDALRAAIRADILQDPRSAEMSVAEIDALVSALSIKAEEQGVALEYLDSETNFGAASEAVTPDANTDPLIVALLALFGVLACVTLFLIWQRNVRRSLPPSAGMVA